MNHELSTNSRVMRGKIDLNCDLGESFGAYRLGSDEAIMPFISSANIACGFHAGDPAVMRRTVKLCMEYGVAIGAHPGLPDLAGFGRRAMQITADEAFEMVIYQLGALLGFVRAEGGSLRHVKPHGALYNMAAADPRLAEAIAEAVARVDSGLVLFGLSGSQLTRAARKYGLQAAEEVFADRTYRADGSLTPRSESGAVWEEPADAAAQVIRMASQGSVLTREGTEVPVQADTVCIHGDGPHAVRFAEVIRRRLEGAGLEIAAL